MGRKRRRRRWSDLTSSSCPAMTSLRTHVLRLDACRVQPKEIEILQEGEHREEVE